MSAVTFAASLLLELKAFKRLTNSGGVRVGTCQEPLARHRHAWERGSTHANAPAPRFEMLEKFSSTTELHNKVHTFLILKGSQQVNYKRELHQPQHISLSSQVLCLHLHSTSDHDTTIHRSMYGGTSVCRISSCF